jgi:acetyltransferase-like isoleucine patch superfamily enzyme
MAGRFALYRSALREQAAQLKERRALEARFPGARFEELVRVVSPQLLELGENVLVQRNTLLHCGGLDWSGGRGRIAIGAGSTISHNCVFFGAGEIETGLRFGCGPGCQVYSSRDRFEGDPGGSDHEFAKVTFEDDVLLFASCIVGPGVTIGRGAVIGASSLVLRDVPPLKLYAGSPAREIRDLSQTRRLPA